MNKLLGFLFIFLVNNSQAEFKFKKTEINSLSNRRINIAGVIEVSKEFSVRKLTATVWKNYIYGYSKWGSYELEIPVNKDGSFKVNLPANDHPMRLRLANGQIVIFDLQLIEPGDEIMVKIRNQDGTIFKQVTGKGYEKYECVTNISEVKRGSLWGEKKPLNFIQKSDSIVREKLAILRFYESTLNSNIFKLLKADIIGQEKGYASFLVVNKILNSKDSFENKQWSDLFLRMYQDIDTTNGKILSSSPYYIDYLYFMSKYQLKFFHPIADVQFKNLYNQLRRKYGGVLRDKLLINSLFNSTDIKLFFPGSNADDFTNCLKDALHIVKVPYLRNFAKRLLRTNGKGARPYDFSLTCDTSETIISLKDFKGKVVLLDFWPFMCTGCYTFAKEFHEKVYPQFKDNPNFVVISVFMATGDDPKQRELYRIRLRHEDGYTYTYKEYVNLFGGKNTKVLENYYNITAYPYLLLLDKRGRVFSSTIPYLGQSEKLSFLINDALNEQSH